MPVVIGRKPESTFADPIGLLGDCHRRIERFLSVLVQVATKAHGGSLSDDQHSAWNTALRYFREAPKHTADEEESLFPRLRGIDRPEVQALLARVDTLEEQHVCAGKAHDEVDRLGRLWLADGGLSPEQTSPLSIVLAQLSELYSSHRDGGWRGVPSCRRRSIPCPNVRRSAPKWRRAAASSPHFRNAATFPASERSADPHGNLLHPAIERGWTHDVAHRLLASRDG